MQTQGIKHLIVTKLNVNRRFISNSVLCSQKHQLSDEVKPEAGALTTGQKGRLQIVLKHCSYI